MIVKKNKVRESTEKKVASDFYEKLNEKVEELIEEAEGRAKEEGRSTVLGRHM